jgi:hypothetical protein
MSEFMALSGAEQVGIYFRGQMASGRLHGAMPGVLLLEAELGANRKTVETELRLLEADGLLLPQGQGKRRLFRPTGGDKTQFLRLVILTGEPAEMKFDYLVELRHTLVIAGHQVDHASKTMMELRIDAKCIARMLQKTKADAWVVLSGPVELLDWFAKRQVPVFALFGRLRRFPNAGAGPNPVV